MRLALIAPAGADGFYGDSRPGGAMMDELRMLELIHRGTPEAAVPLARAVALIGATPTVWTMVGASALLAGVRSRSWGSMLCPVGALAAAAVARRALAAVIDRPRPPQRLWRVAWSGPSFPSRHTTLGTVAAGLAGDALAPGHRAYLMAWLVGGAIGASRLVLGVHWPSDVVAGWSFAAVALAAARHIAVPRWFGWPHRRAARVRAASPVASLKGCR